MYKTTLLAALVGGLAFTAPVAALTAPKPTKLAAASPELSAQQYRPRTRLRVYPGGRLLYRDCSFRLAQQWRPSGTVIVPVQHCWWVRG
jgi:hypothetical protein